MARPRKKGLDYFPLDVDIFDDEKLFDVQNEYGPLGEAVYLRLVCLVYKNGYYLKFDSIEKLAAMVIRSIGSRWVENKREIVEIIEYLVECGLFSNRLYEKNILTSKGIQTRFKLATERRRSGIREYSLIEENKFNVENTSDIIMTENCNIPENTYYGFEKEFSDRKSVDVREKLSACNTPDSMMTENCNIPKNTYYGFEKEFSDRKLVDVREELSVYDTTDSMMTENCNIPDNTYCGFETELFDRKSVDVCDESVIENTCDSRIVDNFDTSGLNSLNYDDFLKDSEEMSDFARNVSVSNNEGFCCNNPTKKSKVNKSKVNEREEEIIPDTEVGECCSSSANRVVNVFNSICSSLPKVRKLTEERIRAVKNAAARVNGDFEGLFKRVESSDFLTGRNGKWLNCSFDWIFKPSNLTKILNGNYDNWDFGRGGYSGFVKRSEFDDRAYFEGLRSLAVF